jgi:hypothetical protein
MAWLLITEYANYWQAGEPLTFIILTLYLFVRMKKAIALRNFARTQNPA